MSGRQTTAQNSFAFYTPLSLDTRPGLNALLDSEAFQLQLGDRIANAIPALDQLHSVRQNSVPQYMQMIDLSLSAEASGSPETCSVLTVPVLSAEGGDRR